MRDKTGGYEGPPLIQRALLNTDGGSRGNPGPSGIGFTLKVEREGEFVTICRGGAPIGEGTNNVAEYQALLWGLRNALALRVLMLEVCADSELLVRQLLGEYRVKNAGIKPLYAEAVGLLGQFASYSIRHVVREFNAEADALANEAMDTGQAVGDFVCSFERGELFAEDAGGADAQPYEPPCEEQADPPQPAHAGRYTLSIKEHFDAAHALIGYPGECCNLHGHTWDVEVAVSGTKLDEVGILYDFKALKADLLRILDTYDHRYLNEVPPFDTLNATAENLARIVYEQLAAALPAHIRLEEVSVWESPIAKLTYRR